jgi:hypothetical protein
MENHDHDYLIECGESDRESAIQYCIKNDHVIGMIKSKMNREYLTSLDDSQLQSLVRLKKGFIRDFPNDYQEK